jgi:outer membrane protein
MKISSLLIAGLTALAASCLADLPKNAPDSTGNSCKQAHPWLVRLRALDMVPQNGSGPFTFGESDIPADAIHLNTKMFPEADVSYFFTRHIATELILTYPQQHDVSIAGVGKIGTLSHLPPTLMAQYHLPIQNQPWEPYAGVGVNFTWITAANLEAGNTPLDVTRTSLGLAVGAGIDYKLTSRWVLNFDYKHVWIHTNVKAGSDIVTNVDVNPNLFGFGVGYRF